MLKALAILFLIIGLLMSGSGIGTFIYFKIFIKEKVHEVTSQTLLNYGILFN